RVSLLAVAVFGFVGGAFGQADLNGPTDTDLKAAYCLGSRSVQVAALRRWCDSLSVSDPSSVSDCRDQEWKSQADLDQLESYLLARGYALNDAEPLAISQQRRQGSHDNVACGRSMEAQGRIKQQCVDNCLVGQTECVDNC